MKLTTPILGALLTSTFLPLTTQANDTESFEDIVVTATRTSGVSTSSLSSVSVITEQDIKQYQYQSLAEALNSLPGISIANTGGLGKLTSLFMRGTESNHTQILINGVKLATNSFGTPQIEHIPLETVERIEVVRGPQSGLYGSSSIGGTIQIFTKQATSGFKPFANAAIGSDNTKKINGGFGAGNDFGWVNVQAGYTSTNGFNACDSRSADLFIGCFADEPDRDGYQNRHHSLRAGLNVTDTTDIEVFSLYTNSDTEFDGFYNHSDVTQHTYGISINTALSQNWNVRSQISQGRFDSKSTGSGTGISNNTKDMFSIQSDLTVAENHLFSIGYDYEDDENDTDAATVAERNNHGVFTQLQGNVDDFDYRLTLRHDDNEQYGTFNSGNIAFGYQLTSNLQAYISYGEAFTAPSFIDLDPASFGNPDLLPEESETIEIGLKGNHADINWSIALFETDITNLITLDSFFIPQNISKANIRGVEVTAKTRWLGVNWDAQLSLLDPTNDSNDANEGNILPRRAQNTFSVKANKQWKKFSLATVVNYSGRRFDNAANTRRLAPHTTVDITAGYKIAPSTQVQLKIANLFDESYETASGYNANDTNALLSISYQTK